jgi:hypothetical protein
MLWHVSKLASKAMATHKLQIRSVHFPMDTTLENVVPNIYPVVCSVCKDENSMEIFRTNRFHFLYYDTDFYIMVQLPNFAKHKNLSFSIGFTTIFNHFLYSLIAKM